jgi:cytidylate kinase
MASENKSDRFQLHPTRVIAIDGPAGAGKSTVAKAVARALHYFYLDTGAMYRALTLKALIEQVDLDNEEMLFQLARHTHIDLQETADGLHVFLDHSDVTERIRSVEVTNTTSKVAAKPKVRSIMVEWQRKIASERNIVIEGRDTGTVVFPDASYKFYLDADLAERARRRATELRAKGTYIEEEELIHQINERDHKDMNRSSGPLKKAADAIVIDTTDLSVDATASRILQHISKHA